MPSWQAVLRGLTYEGIPLWRHTRIIQWVLQVVSGILVVVLVVWFFANITGAIQARDIPHGFSFLSREYQTSIGQHFLPYESTDTFLYAFVVATTNTIVVSIVGVILATALGIFIGVSRMSGNWLVSKAALVYIEFFRNVPLLVQLFFWFYIVLALPTIQEEYVIADMLHINNRGVSMPWPDPVSAGAAWMFPVVLVVAAFAGVAVHRAMQRRETLTGAASYPMVLGVGASILIVAIGWVALSIAFDGAPFTISIPEARETRGGSHLHLGGFTASAGLMALLVGLVMYTSSFIAEIVRAGIQSVGRGQREAARSLGLPYLKALRHVTFPQSLRVIVPPMISQYLNLTKNSSLAGAIGFSDLTNVAKTMTQTAPAVSIFLLIMLAYLAMSLTYSLIGNLYNRHIRFS